MQAQPVWRVVALGTLLGVALIACEQKRSGGTEAAATGSVTMKPAEDARPGDTNAGPKPLPLEAPPAAVSREEPPEQSADGEQGPDKALLTRLADVGPAGPATAHAGGIVMVTRDDEVLVARYQRGAPAGRQFVPVSAEADKFSPFGRGPTLLGDHAYWVSGSRLVRRRHMGPGQIEVLAEDAQPRTRTSGALLGKRPAIAYIARDRASGELVASLWLERSGSVQLSSSGTAANSVSLSPIEGGLLAAWLEGRTSMTPFHARSLRDTGQDLALGDDVVVWVGGSSQPTTEITTLVAFGEVHGLVAIEQDALRFGLARLRVGPQPTMNDDVTWRPYPNGLDPAPLATLTACGKPSVLYVRPSTADPGSPKELHLSALGPEGLGPSRVVARARAISDVSGFDAGAEAMVAYVADQRTWALPITCKR